MDFLLQALFFILANFALVGAFVVLVIVALFVQVVADLVRERWRNS